MNWTIIIPPVLTAFGVGLLIHSLLTGLFDLYTRVRLGARRRRLTRAVMRATRSAQDESRLPGEAELYGLPPNLTLWMIGAALIGFLVSLLVIQSPRSGEP